MIGKLASAMALAVASAAFSPVAVAGPVNIDVRVGPPAPRYEAVPASRPGHVWSPGHWQWRGGRHHWVAGQWLRERPGYVYTQPTWVQTQGRWHYYNGDWARRGDRDGDGIPNRYDRDRDGDGVRNRDDRFPNNPSRQGLGRANDRDRDGIPNRVDRDRDGDGVRNRNDRRPDNPRRN